MTMRRIAAHGGAVRCAGQVATAARMAAGFAARVAGALFRGGWPWAAAHAEGAPAPCQTGHRAGHFGGEYYFFVISNGLVLHSPMGRSEIRGRCYLNLHFR